MAREERKRGRPEGTFKKRRFLDTPLGRFIYLHEPLLYRVICPKDAYGHAPEIALIEKVTSLSDNPSFRTERFKKYLSEYRERGLHVPRAKPITEEHLEYYRNLRFTRALGYVRKHRREIEDRDRLVREIIQAAVDRAEGREGVT